MRILKPNLYINVSSRGYADGEIEAMFAKYDIDGDRVLDEEEQRRMQADLTEQKVSSPQAGWSRVATQQERALEESLYSRLACHMCSCSHPARKSVRRIPLQQAGLSRVFL